MAEGSPTVRRRELGALLRRLREDRGMSVKQVTERLLCSPSKVSRIETGQRGATLRDVRDLCDLYGVADQTERDQLMRLAREGKEQGWWQSYDLPATLPHTSGSRLKPSELRTTTRQLSLACCSQLIIIAHSMMIHFLSRPSVELTPSWWTGELKPASDVSNF